MKIMKNCPQCNNSYIPRFRLAKFCSRKCWVESQKEKISRSCLKCKTEFKTISSRVKTGHGKYCSKKCALMGWKRGENKNCLVCKKEFYISKSQLKIREGKYCSSICYYIASRKSNINKSHPCKSKGIRRLEFLGEKNPNWKGGMTTLKELIRKSLENELWKTQCRKRDNYTCQICGDNKGGNLNVDHYPKTFAQLIKENNIKSLEDAINCKALWDINNGRTLCISCHIKTDTYPKSFSKKLLKYL